jgi:hypothetical protein
MRAQTGRGDTDFEQWAECDGAISGLNDVEQANLKSGVNGREKNLQKI